MFDPSPIVLVVGNSPKPFGTGFVIHSDESATYVLTCTHVIRDVEKLRVNGRPADVIASDEARFGFDLAVLRVEGKLNCSCLPLNPGAKPGRPFVAAGYCDQAGQYVLQQFRGTLGPPAGLRSQKFGHCMGWELDMGTDGRFEDGYSGSPVIDETSGRVFGIVAIRMDQASGKRGIAIGVAALRDIWISMPSNVSKALALRPGEGSAGPTVPVMNLVKEVETFRSVLAGQEGQGTSSIVIDGSSGMGKTYLLQIYRKIAEAEGFDVQDFGLAAQTSVQHCLSTIVGRFGLEHFRRYEQYLDSMTPPPDPEAKTTWQDTLTRHFFRDLAEHAFMAPLVVFFDQYEKADPIFKMWLRNAFLPSINSRIPLVVVVAGQGAEPLSTRCHFFRLNGLEMEHFYRFAEACKVSITAEMIEAFHGAWNGRPKEFAEFISYQTRTAIGDSR
jgi:hypothetical protein